MNPEIKDRWLQKLESGEYEQTTGELRNDEGFCCLGVLCEVAVEDGIICRGDSGYLSTGPDGMYVENSTLPREVVKWAGLESINPTVPFELQEDDCPCGEPHDDDVETTKMELSELNDSERLTFREIASYIKDNL